MSTPVATAASASPAYPLQISANGRYLVDQNNVPYLLVGDSPQALIGVLSESDADVFFANRQQYGFNSVWINLLCNEGTGCKADGSTYAGIPPFTKPSDLATPNDEYFMRAKNLITLAGKYGMNVMLDPIETAGWLKVLMSNGRDKAYNYGLYLGSYYKNVPNIIWMSGNDFQTWRDPNDDALVLAVAQGIKAADPGHLQTAELDYYLSSTLDDPNWTSVVQLEAAYTYKPTYAEVLKDYSRTNYKPVFMVEANYELEHEYSGPATLRRQEYWALLGGATGHLYGNRYTWPFAQGWQSHLDTIGSAQMAYATSFFASRPWYDLIPDQQHALVTSGFGEFSNAGSVNDNDYATAAVSSDGRLAVAYVPTERTLTVDMTKLATPVQARWFDPSNGSYTTISDNLANAGTHDFTTPGRNSGGDGDWVLVLELPPQP